MKKPIDLCRSQAPPSLVRTGPWCRRGSTCHSSGLYLGGFLEISMGFPQIWVNSNNDSHHFGNLMENGGLMGFFMGFFMGFNIHLGKL